MRTNTPMTAAEQMGLGPKKTALVLFTVVGCIAILFPKIFYPMLMGTTVKDRGPSNLLKQERPTHIDELVYPSMQERGRAIPPHTVPIVERPGFPGGLPQRPGTIERRPGSPLVQGHPGPSMRAASFQAQQQQTQKGQSSSIIMPIYTFGIVAFFVFTIVKIVMKKIDNKKVKPLESDPVFVDKVFKQSEPDPKKKLVYTAIQGIIDATDDQLREIEKDCALNNEEHFDRSSVKKSESEEEEKSPEVKEADEEEPASMTSDELMKVENDEEDKENKKKAEPTEHDLQVERRIENLREALHIRAVENDENSDLKSIYLEGELPHDPKILVSATETETKTGRMSNYSKDVADDEAVILSGKMTISLISLTSNDEDGENGVVEDHTTTNNVA